MKIVVVLLILSLIMLTGCVEEGGDFLIYTVESNKIIDCCDYCFPSTSCTSCYEDFTYPYGSIKFKYFEDSNYCQVNYTHKQIGE